MKISAKGKYAVKLMMDLAIYSTGKPTSLKDISKRQNISEKFLEQIIAILNHAGFVGSARGSQGGYWLTKDPEEYTVGMILRLTEADLIPHQEKVKNLLGDGSVEEFITQKVAEQMNQAVNQVVDELTLGDLIDWQNGLSIDQYII